MPPPPSTPESMHSACIYISKIHPTLIPVTTDRHKKIANSLLECPSNSTVSVMSNNAKCNQYITQSAKITGIFSHCCAVFKTWVERREDWPSEGWAARNFQMQERSLWNVNSFQSFTTSTSKVLKASGQLQDIWKSRLCKWSAPCYIQILHSTTTEPPQCLQVVWKTHHHTRPENLRLWDCCYWCWPERKYEAVFILQDKRKPQGK